MTSTMDTTTLWVCIDCYATHVNGSWGDDPDHTPDCEPLGRIGESDEITAGLLSDEHECDYAAGEWETCDCERMSFSWRTCDGCGSHLGGERNALTLWTAS